MSSPIWNCLMKKWQLCISIPSMRTHSKQSIDKKVTGDVLHPFETAWWKSDSYLFPYHQWEPIWNSQLIRKYQYIYKHRDTKGRWIPLFKTARAQSDLCTVQCGQWEPIWNSQLIKNIRKYQWIYKHRDTKGRWTPHLKLPVKRLIS